MAHPSIENPGALPSDMVGKPVVAKQIPGPLDHVKQEILERYRTPPDGEEVQEEEDKCSCKSVRKSKEPEAPRQERGSIGLANSPAHKTADPITRLSSLLNQIAAGRLAVQGNQGVNLKGAQGKGGVKR